MKMINEKRSIFKIDLFDRFIGRIHINADKSYVFSFFERNLKEIVRKELHLSGLDDINNQTIFKIHHKEGILIFGMAREIEFIHEEDTRQFFSFGLNEGIKEIHDFHSGNTIFLSNGCKGMIVAFEIIQDMNHGLSGETRRTKSDGIGIVKSRMAVFAEKTLVMDRIDRRVIIVLRTNKISRDRSFNNDMFGMTERTF